MTKLEAWLEEQKEMLKDMELMECHKAIAVIEKLKVALEDLSCLNEPDYGLSKNEYIACLEQNKYLANKVLAIDPEKL